MFVKPFFNHFLVGEIGGYLVSRMVCDDHHISGV